MTRRVAIAAAALGIGACGNATQSSARGAGGSTGVAGQLQVAGSPGGGGGGDAGESGGTSTESSSGGLEQAAGSGGTPVVCIAHERPAPDNLTLSFAQIAAGLVGVYQINDVFAQSDECSNMCRLGEVIHAPYHDDLFLALELTNVGALLRVIACPTRDCSSQTQFYSLVAGVAVAESDRILSARNTFVQLPQGQQCTGGPLDTWLVASAPGKIQVDIQRVSVAFPAQYDSTNGVWACRSADADSAAQGKPCNSLSVIFATRVE